MYFRGCPSGGHMPEQQEVFPDLIGNREPQFVNKEITLFRNGLPQAKVHVMSAWSVTSLKASEMKSKAILKFCQTERGVVVEFSDPKDPSRIFIYLCDVESHEEGTVAEFSRWAERLGYATIQLKNFVRGKAKILQRS